MCLSNVVCTLDVPEESHRGWKVFRVYNGRLHLPYYTSDGKSPRTLFAQTRHRAEAVKLGCWLQAAHVVIDSSDGQDYLTGFHVFHTKRDAERWAKSDWAFHEWEYRLVRVECRKIRVYGEHRTFPPGHKPLRVFVCDEIFIPREP